MCAVSTNNNKAAIQVHSLLGIGKIKNKAPLPATDSSSILLLPLLSGEVLQTAE